MRQLDARSKIFILLFFSVGIFFVDSLVGMALLAAALPIVAILSRCSLRRILPMGIPAYVIAVFAFAFNAFRIGDSSAVAVDGADGSSIIFDAGWLHMTTGGLVLGLVVALRICLLVWSCLILCMSTTSENISDAICKLLRPLARLHVPVDDISMVISIALRFIPITYDEFKAIRDAQWSRGASFDVGGPIPRLKALSSTLIPLTVSLFRKADDLAEAMDVRCYGIPGVRRTMLQARRASTAWDVLLPASCALALALVAYFL